MPRFAVRWLARLLVLVAILAAGAFVLFRTPLGLDMVGRAVAWMVSEPGIRIAISGLGSNAPFDITAKRIEDTTAFAGKPGLGSPHPLQIERYCPEGIDVGV